jgi:hypothetical protein
MTDEETSTRMPSPEAAAAAAAEMEGYKEQDIERQERGAPETKAPAQTTKEDCAKDCEADTPKPVFREIQQSILLRLTLMPLILTMMNMLMIMTKTGSFCCAPRQLQ